MRAEGLFKVFVRSRTLSGTHVVEEWIEPKSALYFERVIAGGVDVGASEYALRQASFWPCDLRTVACQVGADGRETFLQQIRNGGEPFSTDALNVGSWAAQSTWSEKLGSMEHCASDSGSHDDCSCGRWTFVVNEEGRFKIGLWCWRGTEPRQRK